MWYSCPKLWNCRKLLSLPRVLPLICFCCCKRSQSCIPAAEAGGFLVLPPHNHYCCYRNWHAQVCSHCSSLNRTACASLLSSNNMSLPYPLHYQRRTVMAREPGKSGFQSSSPDGTRESVEMATSGSELLVRNMAPRWRQSHGFHREHLRT